MDPKEVKKRTPVYYDREGNVVTDPSKAWSVEWTYVYADGTKQVWKTGPNEDPEKVGTLQSSGVDEPQQRVWNDQQKQQTPSATSQATAARDTIPVDGRIKQWNPETSRYDIDVGAAGTTAAASGPNQERAAQQQVERQRNSQATGIPLDDVEKAQWDAAKQKEQQATDERGRAEARQQRLDIEASANRIWQQGLAERQLSGTEAERARAASVQERQLSGQEAERARVASLQERDQSLQENAPIKTEHGIFRPVRDESGAVISMERIPGEQSNAAITTPDLAQATLGKYTDQLKKQWDEKYVPLIAAGTMTKAEATDQFTKVDRALAESKANEEIAVLSAQQNIRGQDVTQQGQALDSVESQRRGLTSTFNQAQASIKPADAGGYYPAIIAEIMKLYGQSQEQAGLPRGVPSQQPYTAQQAQVMGAPGPSPIVFNINTGGGQGGAPTSPMASVGTQMGLPGGMPEAPGMPPPTSPEQLLDEMGQNSPDPFWTQATERVREDLLRARQGSQAQPGREMTPSPAVAGGMRWAGGQLRAPGASAGPVSGGPVGQVGG